jgi:uncharacterized protein
LKDGAPEAGIPPVAAFETGTNTWRRLPAWPAGCASGCTVQAKRLIDTASWSRWLVDDQREQSGRPDVAVFVSDVLSAPLKISGQPVANLIASTSGTDSEWVVKVIDLYPDEVARQPAMGGYQLMISADIFRGRYRESLEVAKPISPDTPLLYRFALPTANIFWAKPADFRKPRSRFITRRARRASSSCLWS